MTLKKEKTATREFDNISITAYRIISILNMLLEEPLSDDEINKKLQETIEGSRSLSKDTICIYIKTLRAIGCDISRSSKKNNYKYVLKSHPFRLTIDSEEINTLVEIKKYITSLGDWKLSLEADDLYNKIFDITVPDSKKDYLVLKSTVLCREVGIDNLIEELNLIESYCKKQQDLQVIYNSPNSGEKVINLKAEKITLENSSFYLWGYNYDIDEVSYLRLDKIQTIKPVILKEKRPREGFEAKYLLTGISAYSFVPGSSCKILEKRKDNELLIQTKVTNKFKFIQDVLSYGADCTVISPESVRREIIQKFQMMNEINKDVYAL